MIYSREFLIDAFLSRYDGLDNSNLKILAERLYDRVGKDKFRVYASLTPSAIQIYRSKKCT